MKYFSASNGRVKGVMALMAKDPRARLCLTFRLRKRGSSSKQCYWSGKQIWEVKSVGDTQLYGLLSLLYLGRGLMLPLQSVFLANNTVSKAGTAAATALFPPFFLSFFSPPKVKSSVGRSV